MKNIKYISAGAGSGKTYTLTEQLAADIRDGKVRPDQVILTTFTKKAAAEFKEKSKAKLFEKGLFEEANLLDGAMIGTVHSVANAVISKFWYYLGIPDNPNTIDEENKKMYIAQSLSDLPTKEQLQVFKKFTDKFDIRDTKYKGQPDYNFWQDHLDKVIEYSTNHEITDYTKSRKRSKEIFLKFVKPNNPPLPDEKQLRGAIAEIKAFLMTDEEKNSEPLKYLGDAERKVSDPSYFNYKKVLEYAKKIKKDRSENLSDVIEKLESMWHGKEVYDLIHQYIDVVFDLAEKWRKEYEKFKKERKIIDYNDMEKYFLQLLRDPEASKEIGKQYRYVYVDEFQDCSPIQLKIFMRLAELAQQSYWVGDMKQAIYGFRGTDTVLTDSVARAVESFEGKGCSTSTLPDSYRSVPEIVNFCNDIFTMAFCPEVPVEKVTLNPKKKSDPSTEALAMFSGKKEMALAAQIHAMLEQGIKASDIALLARKNTVLDKVATLLESMGVKVNREGRSVSSYPAATLVKAVLTLADNEADTLAKAQIAFMLDSRFDTEKIISETLASIDPATGRATHDFLDEVKVLKKLSKVRERLRRQSLAEFVESVILELNLFEEAAKCCSPDDAERVLQAIIMAAKNYENRIHEMGEFPTVKGFIDFIDSGSVKIPGDPDGVGLYTIHSSKGLEWKHVIVTTLDQDVLSNLYKKEFFGVHFRRDVSPSEDNFFPDVHITLLPFIYGSGNTNVPTSIREIINSIPGIKRLEADKLNEEKRLLYVALTRPTHQLILHNNGGNNAMRWFRQSGVKGETTFASRYSMKETSPELEECDLPADAPLPVHLTYPVDDEECMTERRYHSPSQEEGTAKVMGSKDFKQRIPLKSNKETKMNEVGNCIHDIFRLCGSSPASSSAMKEVIGAYSLEENLTDVEAVKRSWENLNSYIAERHGKISAWRHERPFIFHKEGKIYTGSVDLTLDSEDGCILVDYKSCPMGNNAILDEEGKHFAGLYGGQLSCYREALEEAGEKVKAGYLYYPVSGMIVQLF